MSDTKYVCWKCRSTTFTVRTTEVSLYLHCTGCDTFFPLLMMKSELRYLHAMSITPPSLQPKAF